MLSSIVWGNVNWRRGWIIFCSWSSLCNVNESKFQPNSSEQSCVETAGVHALHNFSHKLVLYWCIQWGNGPRCCWENGERQQALECANRIHHSPMPCHAPSFVPMCVWFWCVMSPRLRYSCSSHLGSDFTFLFRRIVTLAFSCSRFFLFTSQSQSVCRPVSSLLCAVPVCLLICPSAVLNDHTLTCCVFPIDVSLSIMCVYLIIHLSIPGD